MAEPSWRLARCSSGCWALWWLSTEPMGTAVVTQCGYCAPARLTDDINQLPFLLLFFTHHMAADQRSRRLYFCSVGIGLGLYNSAQGPAHHKQAVDVALPLHVWLSCCIALTQCSVLTIDELRTVCTTCTSAHSQLGLDCFCCLTSKVGSWNLTACSKYQCL